MKAEAGDSGCGGDGRRNPAPRAGVQRGAQGDGSPTANAQLRESNFLVAAVPRLREKICAKNAILQEAHAARRETTPDKHFQWKHSKIVRKVAEVVGRGKSSWRGLVGYDDGLAGFVEFADDVVLRPRRGLRTPKNPTKFARVCSELPEGDHRLPHLLRDAFFPPGTPESCFPPYFFARCLSEVDGKLAQRVAARVTLLPAGTDTDAAGDHARTTSFGGATTTSCEATPLTRGEGTAGSSISSEELREKSTKNSEKPISSERAAGNARLKSCKSEGCGRGPPKETFRAFLRRLQDRPETVNDEDRKRYLQYTHRSAFQYLRRLAAYRKKHALGEDTDCAAHASAQADAALLAQPCYLGRRSGMSWETLRKRIRNYGVLPDAEWTTTGVNVEHDDVVHPGRRWTVGKDGSYHATVSPELRGKAVEAARELSRAMNSSKINVNRGKNKTARKMAARVRDFMALSSRVCEDPQSVEPQEYSRYFHWAQAETARLPTLPVYVPVRRGVVRADAHLGLADGEREADKDGQSNGGESSSDTSSCSRAAYDEYFDREDYWWDDAEYYENYEKQNRIEAAEQAAARERMHDEYRYNWLGMSLADEESARLWAQESEEHASSSKAASGSASASKGKNFTDRIMRELPKDLETLICRTKKEPTLSAAHSAELITNPKRSDLLCAVKLPPDAEKRQREAAERLRKRHLTEVHANDSAIVETGITESSLRSEEERALILRWRHANPLAYSRRGRFLTEAERDVLVRFRMMRGSPPTPSDPEVGKGRGKQQQRERGHVSGEQQNKETQRVMFQFLKAKGWNVNSSAPRVRVPASDEERSRTLLKGLECVVNPAKNKQEDHDSKLQLVARGTACTRSRSNGEEEDSAAGGAGSSCAIIAGAAAVDRRESLFSASTQTPLLTPKQRSGTSASDTH